MYVYQIYELRRRWFFKGVKEVLLKTLDDLEDAKQWMDLYRKIHPYAYVMIYVAYRD